MTGRSAAPTPPRPARRRLAALAATAVTVAAGGAGLLAGVAAASPPPAAPAGAAAAPTAPGPALVAQSAVVRTGRNFVISLGLPAGASAGDELSLAVLPRLTSRIAFDDAAVGRTGGVTPLQTWTVDLAARSAPAGVLTLTLPVAGPGSGRDLAPFLPEPGDESGVYPLEVGLVDASGTPVGPTLSTFLVYDWGTAGYQPLGLSLTVPVGAAPDVAADGLPTTPGAATTDALGSFLSVLRSSGVPLTLAVSPQTVAALSGSSTGRTSVLGALSGLRAAGDEILPEPWVDLSAPSELVSGLGAQLDDELDTGVATLARDVGGGPIGQGTWVTDAPIDDASLQVLVGRGLRRLIVPSADLSPLPEALQSSTYGHPTVLDDGDGDRGLTVVGADAQLAERFTQHTGPVLAAEQTLAELAMIELEYPSLPRAVAVIAPAAVAGQTAFYETLLAGLRHDPFVAPLTARGLFASVHPLSTDAPAGSTTPVGTGTPAPSGGGPVSTLVGPAPAPAADAAAVTDLVAATTGALATVPSDHLLRAQLRAALLLAPSLQLPETERQALLGTALTRIHDIGLHIALPATSVTLTSLTARLPLTLFSSSRTPLHVELVLTSPKLAFLAYRPRGVACTATARGVETCQLVLVGHQTLLRVPVESRTSGVFALSLSVRSPDGSIVLASARDTVRSTAVSFVGLVIIVVACLFLGIWWIRDIRSGRRARSLVRRPDDLVDPDDGDGPPDGPDGPGGDDAGPPSGTATVGPAPPERPVPRVPVPAGPLRLAVRAAPRQRPPTVPPARPPV